MMILIFLISFLLFVTIFLAFTQKSARAKKRLKDLEHHRELRVDDDRMKQSLRQRLITGPFSKAGERVLRFTPGRMQKRLKHRIEQTGDYSAHALRNFILKRSIFTIAIPLAVYFLLFFLELDSFRVLMFTVLMAMITYLGFNLSLSIRMKKRLEELQRELPDSIDLITVSVEAGLSFDGALARLVQSMDNALALEFSILLKELRMGVQRRVALKNMIARCDVQDIQAFLSSIIQADELGVSIGNILKIQSHQMREKRRQRAREKSMKAPIKMLFPLIFFIFPTLFVVILGPALIQIFEQFSSGF